MIVFFFVFYILFTNLKPTSTEGGGSYLSKRCHNLKVENVREETIQANEEEKTICKIIVRCEANLLTKKGCPSPCPSFTRPPGSIPGLIIGGILGEIAFPYGGGIPGAAVGALFGDSLMRSGLEKQEAQCKAQGKAVDIRYIPSNK